MGVEPTWVERSSDTEPIDRLVDALGCSRPLATILAGRGLTEPEAARRSIEPSADAIHHPRTLPDVEAVVDRLDAALDGDEVVGVFADRDVDGIGGAAVLVPLFEELGATVRTRIPGKWDGYGLDESSVEALADRGVDLVVAVDCGTTAHDAVARARELGVEVAVIDHHDPDDRLPPAVGCVNPRRADSEYPHEHLAAGAVAWKVGQALVERRAPHRIETYHRRSLPLAAVTTLGDYMSLTVENRAIVREGFDRLPDCGLPGLVETATHCGVDSMRDVGWSLVPLLNAAQEDESGSLMLEVLLARDRERIQDTIELLEQYREQRRRDRAERRDHLEARVDDQFDPDADDLVFVETGQWVGGGPMSRVASEWGRPVVTYRESDDGYRGGGRTDGGVDLLELYEACSDLLEEWWGHPGAAGFRLDGDSVAEFRERLERALRERYDPADLRPTVEIDATLDVEQVTTELVEEVRGLGPFGTDHEEPVVMLEAVEIEVCETFGANDDHCKLSPAADCEVVVIEWGGADASGDREVPGSYDVVGTLGVDDYADAPAVFVDDWRRCG